MEMNTVSGAGTRVLLAALLFDYVVAPDLRWLTCAGGVPQSPGPRFSGARPPSRDQFLAYERAASIDGASMPTA
jgi:hypothetical protein